MSDPASQTSKRRNRRKKKKNGEGKVEGASETGSEDGTMPKQSSDQAEGVVTTSKCQRCKRPFRQFAVTPSSPSSDSAQPWRMCPHCMLTSEEDKMAVVDGTGGQSSQKDLSTYGCNCTACVSKRESVVPPEVEREAQITQTYWMEIRHIVRCIYRDHMTLSSHATRSSIGSDKMRMIVKRLCSRDPHQFFQRLETLAREYLLEVKVRLLEQLSCGFNSPQLAIEFIQMLLDEYSSLTSSLPPLLYLLEPLEESEYVQGLGVTVELMNKNIFRELIFAESFMSSNLPLIIAQLRLASLASDPYHRNTADALSQRYVALDREMEEICSVWKNAREHLNHHHHHHHEARRPYEIKADGNEFVKMKNSSLPQPHKNKHADSTHRQVGEGHQNTDHDSQLNEWSKLLFKCIRPIGEPEFRHSGEIATHTITLRLDMTELDLRGATPTCCRGDLRRYRRLGLSVDEVVEVSMKLNSLKNLGFNFKIEDLFDEEGFSLSEVNQALRKPRQQEKQQGGGKSGDDVFFIESEDEEEEGEEGREAELTPQEKAEMLRAKERVLRRQESGNSQNRFNDFLQGMTMKIRFMKRLTGTDDTNLTPSNGAEKVMFSSCDQVQMKLTQLELNSVRLVTTGNCIGSELGLSETPPTSPRIACGRSREDYAFVHTDSHVDFLDLLLERRYNLDAMVTRKEQERRASEEKEMTSDLRQFKRGRADSSKRPFSPCVGSEFTSFTPVYLPNSSQPCQCSACVGAIAASITKESTRPLNPTDPSGSEVTIQSSLDQVLSRPQRPKKPPSPPASKEVVWRNWMTTSGSAQLQSHTDHTHLHYHHHHHGDGVDGDSGYGDSLKSLCSVSCDCHDHAHHHISHDLHNGCSSPSHCGSITNGTTSSSSAATTTGAGGGEGSRRYCPCCYCELFGNNGPPPIPTSHNFTKQRDKMRHKLEEKKRRERDLNRHFNIQHNSCEADSRPLDELLAFIEGEEEGEVGGVMVGMATNPSKAGKKKKKPKKIHQPSLPATEEESSDHSHMSHDLPTTASDDREREKVATGSHTHQDVLRSHRVGGKVKGHSNKPHPPTSSTSAVNSTTSSDLQSEELSDDYDDELEAFKKICFAAPAVNRKRIAVSLDMNDLMAKMK